MAYWRRRGSFRAGYYRLKRIVRRMRYRRFRRYRRRY